MLEVRNHSTLHYFSYFYCRNYRKWKSDPNFISHFSPRKTQILWPQSQLYGSSRDGNCGYRKSLCDRSPRNNFGKFILFLYSCTLCLYFVVSPFSTHDVTWTDRIISYSHVLSVNHVMTHDFGLMPSSFQNPKPQTFYISPISNLLHGPF